MNSTKSFSQSEQFLKIRMAWIVKGYGLAILIIS